MVDWRTVLTELFAYLTLHLSYGAVIVHQNGRLFVLSGIRRLCTAYFRVVIPQRADLLGVDLQPIVCCGTPSVSFKFGTKDFVCSPSFQEALYVTDPANLRGIESS
jgi:hypothetical protein